MMAYSYTSATLEELRTLYGSMRALNVRIGNFTHQYNNIESSVLFDTRDSAGWKLIFMKLIEGVVLEVPIKLGYKFSIEGDAAYYRFKEYFGIGGGKGAFSIREFVDQFRGQVPVRYRLNDEKRRAILKYDRLDNESEGIYPIGTTNWEVVHARNPSLPDDKYHRTKKNLDKTQELYPAIYRATRDMDVTIIYGVEPGKKTESMKNGEID